jgi:hypothetical protein
MLLPVAAGHIVDAMKRRRFGAAVALSVTNVDCLR